MVTIAFYLITDRMKCIELFMHFFPKSQQCPSMRNERMLSNILLPNHRNGRLLPSLQSATPIQTKRSDERVKNSDRKFPFKAPI